MPSELNDRLFRLSTLHNTLAQALANGEEGVSAEQILERMDCERKALYRHAQDLRDLGAPLEYDGNVTDGRIGKNGTPSWTWLHTLQGAPGLRLSLDLLLDPDLERDLQDLVVPSRQTRSSKATLTRLTGLFDKSILPHLSQALRERRKLRFQYAKPDGSKTQKTIDPLSLFVWDGMPYLQARDPSTPQVTFKRYAVADLQAGSPGRILPFPSTQGASPPAWARLYRKARAREDPRLREVAFCMRERKWHPDQSLREKPDGSVEFTLPFGDADEAARWILGRGPGFCPVEPTALVKAWKDAVIQLAERSLS
ncbi:MAG: transcriptional regulator [Fibrobacteres bacterium]|nr:transcriptional regulator [Fibrobacterota bacterium]